MTSLDCTITIAEGEQKPHVDILSSAGWRRVDGEWRRAFRDEGTAVSEMARVWARLQRVSPIRGNAVYTNPCGK